MKPNCFCSRLDQSNFKNGYYKVQMRLTEDILGFPPLCPTEMEENTGSERSSFGDQLGWYAKPLYNQGSSRISSRGNREEPWLTVSANQLPNLREEQ